MSQMSAILECQEIVKRFSPEAGPILKDVDLRIEKGKFVIIMGPSGSGKSTLMHIASGLESPSSGKVFFKGEDLFELSERKRTILRRRSLGFVFQFFNLVPNLTVQENITLPLLVDARNQEDYQDYLDELLSFLHLQKRLDFTPGQLSGGEMQRVSIARALVARPEILFADEPTGNVSSKVGNEIMALLEQTSRRFGQAVLLVTHNARDAAYGERVLFLKDGRLSPDVLLEGEQVSETNIFNCLKELNI